VVGVNGLRAWGGGAGAGSRSALRPPSGSLTARLPRRRGACAARLAAAPPRPLSGFRGGRWPRRRGARRRRSPCRCARSSSRTTRPADGGAPRANQPIISAGASSENCSQMRVFLLARWSSSSGHPLRAAPQEPQDLRDGGGRLPRRAGAARLEDAHLGEPSIPRPPSTPAPCARPGWSAAARRARRRGCA